MMFDSYALPVYTTLPDRTLDVDNRVVVPCNTPLRVLVSSTDVLHSWALPDLAVKVDGSPGRINQLGFNISSLGLSYGQCREICGANHSFIPIVLEAIPAPAFVN